MSTTTETRPTADERPFTGGDVVRVVRDDSDAHGSVGVVGPTARSLFRGARADQWVRVEFTWPGTSTKRSFTFRGRDLALAAA